ncbi:MAG: hypothetical protein CL946_03770 [Ectothiorhodospiraceae bacterium]|nr:hypothetical protein [Ectothiorhodospiraceae bacterium]
MDAVNIDYDGSGNQGGAAQIIQEGSDVRSLYPYDGEVFLPSPEGTWPEGYGGWSYLTPNSTDPNHRLIYRNNPDELRFQNATGGTIDALVYYELEAPAIFNQLNLSMTLGGGTGTGTATVFFVAKVGDNFYVSAEGENSINTTFELASGDTDWQLWDFSTNGGDNFKVTFNDLIPANGSNVNAIGFYITGSGSGGVIRNLRQLSYQSEMAQNSVPVILTQILDNGVVGVPYSASLSAEGGDGEVLWSISSGNLPDGLTLNEEGMIFGTPTLADTVEFSVLAIDSDDNDSENDQDIQELSIVINPGVGVLTLLDLIQAYDGTPKSPTAITDPENLSVTFIYNGVEEEPTLPGTYTVEANISDPNYTGSTKDTLIISSAVLVRHGLTLNGEIYGSVQTLLPENITLNGASFIKGDILISGVPTIIQNGNSSYKELINSTGSSAPTHHQIMLNGNSSVEDIVIRVDPIGLPLVEAPSSPEGTDDVFINNSGDEVSDWESLRNLTINGNVSPVSVPPGTYGNFTSNGNGGLSLGTNGSEVPARYNFERLTLNGNGQIQVDGPVIITVNSGLNINGIFGSSDDPSLLVLRIHNGGLTLNGNAEFNGIVHSPSGTVVVNDNSKLNGEVVADRLIVNGNGQIHQVLPKYTNFRISEENNDQVEIETVDLVGRYGLRSNYPNPFHESTLIRYDLPITVEVNIEILDLTGRSIKRIVEETQGPGNYLLEFDASELQKGTYILNFRINNFNQSIRIIKN